MTLSNYDLIYLITNIFGTYVIYKFIKIFFDKNLTNKKIEVLSYLMYYTLISFVYLKYDTPEINLIVNLCLFYFLTFNYASTWKRRLIADAIVYMILLSIEVLVVSILKLINFNQFYNGIDFDMVIALLSTKIVSYIIVLILANFKRVKNNVRISLLHWISVIIIPIGSLIIFSIIMLLSGNILNNLLEIIISILILFLLNIFVFYLYDILLDSYEKKLEFTIMEQLNSAYEKQFDLMKQLQENTRLVWHDLRHHMSVLKELIEAEDRTSALEYLHSAFEYMKINQEYSNTGNIEIDSILNYKIHLAKKMRIEVDLSIVIPIHLKILPFDTSVILGNLLDNAIEATSKVTDNRTIRISIDYDRNILYISLSNPYNDVLQFRNGYLLTTKIDKKNHGLGLISVKKSVEKYHGYINFHYSSSEFHVDVMLYNQTISSSNYLKL